MRSTEILENVFFRVILTERGSKRQYLFAILLIMNWGLKNRGQQKKGTLVLKLGVETPIEL